SEEDSSSITPRNEPVVGISETAGSIASVSPEEIPAVEPSEDSVSAYGAETERAAEPSDAEERTAALQMERPLSAVPQLCPYCQASRAGEEPYCSNCGWIFASPTPVSAAPANEVPRPRLRQRYDLGEPLGERGHVTRYRGVDHG